MADPDARLQFKFLIPAPLKAQLEEAAAAARRSLSAEIIARLEATFADGGLVTRDQAKASMQLLDQQLQPVLARIEELERRVGKAGSPKRMELSRRAFAEIDRKK